MKTCATCGGSGQITKSARTIFGDIRQAAVCPDCGGSGKVPEKACSVCKGKGTKRAVRSMTLKIPAGVDDGAVIRLRGFGEATSGGHKGDLFVNVRVKPHKKFTREGDLILSEQHIGMADAALGSSVDVDTVDGAVTMKIPPGTQSGTDFKLAGHGAPRIKNGGRGDHIVTVIVDTPTKLSRRQQQLLRDFLDF